MKIAQRQTFFSAALLLASAVVLTALYHVFLVVPNERVMGAVQRIFYFHVGCAVSAYCAFGVVLISGIYYLVTRNPKADVILEAAGEVGFVFCSLVLASGMIWAHAAWNTFFRWEPRLASFLLLWFIYLSFVLLRTFGDPIRIAAHSAVLGIVGSLMVPVVVFSIKLLASVPQLHPVVLENHGLKDPRMGVALAIAITGIVLLQAILLWLRTRIGFLARR